jgi:hypothetical protein
VVAGRQLGAHFFPGQVEVEDFDAAARGHHVFDRDAVEFEEAGQDGAVLLGNQVRGLEDEAVQFFWRELSDFVGLRRGESQQAEQRAGKQVDEPDHRVEERSNGVST